LESDVPALKRLAVAGLRLTRRLGDLGMIPLETLADGAYDARSCLRYLSRSRQLLALWYVEGCITDWPCSLGMFRDGLEDGVRPGLIEQLRLYADERNVHVSALL